MNVLSLFDGMSCGLQALKQAGIPVTNYFASEVDKYAIQVAKKNHPEIIHLGDVTKWQEWNLPKIDLLIGGSPCQGFSFAGKQLNFDDPRSALFFEFVKIKEYFKPKYFLLENVKMKKEYQEVISGLLGVEPVLINSALVSAQNRNRLYWSNINAGPPPEDKYIYWGNIRQWGIKEESMYYTEKALKWIDRHSKRTGKKLKIHGNRDKMQMIEASHYKKYSSQRFFGIIDDGLGPGGDLRYITPVECERSQTLPDNYTEGVSNTQRYKMLGNGWTVSVIEHIFKGLKCNQ